METTINLETIILEAYGCKDAHDFQQSFDISMQMIKEITIEAIRQALELAANNANMKVENYKGAYFSDKEYSDNYTDIVVNKNSITDTIKQVK